MRVNTFFLSVVHLGLFRFVRYHAFFSGTARSLAERLPFLSGRKSGCLTTYCLAQKGLDNRHPGSQ